MLDEMERDVWAFWRGFADRPGGVKRRLPAAEAFRSGVALVNYNGLMGAHSSEAALVDEALAEARSWGVPARWIVSEATAAPGVEDLLRARGFTMYEEAPGMAMRARDLAPPVLPEGMTVENRRTDEHVDAWVGVLTDAFEAPPEAALRVREAHAWGCMHDKNREYFLIRDAEGTPVATGLLHASAGVAGVYGIAVRKDRQRQGLGALATRVVVAAGAERGLEVTALQASRAGFPVYERLGFRVVTTVRSWRIA